MIDLNDRLRKIMKDRFGIAEDAEIRRIAEEMMLADLSIFASVNEGINDEQGKKRNLA